MNTQSPQEPPKLFDTPLNMNPQSSGVLTFTTASPLQELQDVTNRAILHNDAFNFVQSLFLFVIMTVLIVRK